MEPMETDFVDYESEWEGCSDTDPIPGRVEAAPAFSNPPADHMLLTTKYDTLDALMDDLYEFSASAHFSVIK
ncbi:hypothetical protein B0T16DRAFT_457165 [Cercophora newfieldiana]|uniref:Uncharacterized protein n=1 Tax=Cercophora newfieldiana TaxID=92897 RepID=A0AA39YC28_9PEZI|nr:hypothetical protein B0T16DRAFT_457165 [Cercophora newfieldiana]